MNQPVFIDQLSTLMSGTVRQELAFSNSEYSRRVDRATAAMRHQGIDVMLSTYLPNICYLTGYQFTNCDYAGFLILASDGRAAMVVPGTEVSTVLLHGWVRDVKDFPSWEPLKAIPLIAGVLQGWNLPNSITVGLETGLELMDLLAYDALQSSLPSANFVDASLLLSTLRRRLGAGEIEHLQQAGRYSDAGMRDALSAIQPEATENAVAAAASAEMIAMGSEFFSTAPQVSAGTRTALPHAMFSRASIAAGDPVVVELAGAYERYSVPIARTYALGAAGSELESLARVARSALEALTARALPGQPIAEAVAAARKVLALHAEEVWPISSFGHAIGVGMPPSWQDDQVVLHDASTDLFEEDMAFYSVVRLHRPGRHGVVIGDSWICRPGAVEPLTALSRDLVVASPLQEHTDV